MTPLTETELRALQEANRRQRPYAGFFAWPERGVAELGATIDFVRAADSEPGFPLTDIKSRPRGDDPPDCEALDRQGRRVAVEVTELVDGASIAHARASDVVRWAAWTSDRIRSELQARMTAKGAIVLKGGPYAELILLIHTDEPLLSSDRVSRAIEGHSFEIPSMISRAYLLLSYSPELGYPYFRL